MERSLEYEKTHNEAFTKKKKETMDSIIFTLDSIHITLHRSLY